MSRLTTSQNYCDNCDFGKEKECFFDGKEQFNCKDKQVYEKLREYEELEEKGLLLKLPCKLGDDLYWINKEYDDDGCEVYEIVKYEDGITGILLTKNGFLVASDNNEPFATDKLGSRWALLSKEQAEQKLKEMEREDK